MQLFKTSSHRCCRQQKHQRQKIHETSEAGPCQCVSMQEASCMDFISWKSTNKQTKDDHDSWFTFSRILICQLLSSFVGCMCNLCFSHHESMCFRRCAVDMILLCLYVFTSDRFSFWKVQSPNRKFFSISVRLELKMISCTSEQFFFQGCCSCRFLLTAQLFVF